MMGTLAGIVFSFVMSVSWLIAASAPGKAQTSEIAPYATLSYVIRPAHIERTTWQNSLSALARLYPGLVHLSANPDAFVDKGLPLRTAQIDMIESAIVSVNTRAGQRLDLVVNRMELKDNDTAQRVAAVWDAEATIIPMEKATGWWRTGADAAAAANGGLLSSTGPQSWHLMTITENRMVTVSSVQQMPDDMVAILEKLQPDDTNDPDPLANRTASELLRGNRSAILTLLGEDAGIDTIKLYDVVKLNQTKLSFFQYTRAILGNYATVGQLKVFENELRGELAAHGDLGILPKPDDKSVISSFHHGEQSGAALTFKYATAQQAKEACEVLSRRMARIRSVFADKTFAKAWPGGTACLFHNEGAATATLLFLDKTRAPEQHQVASKAYGLLYQMLNNFDLIWLLARRIPGDGGE